MINRIICKAEYDGTYVRITNVNGMTITQWYIVDSDGYDNDGLCLLTLNNKLGLWWD